MSELSSVSIPRPRPELLAELRTDVPREGGSRAAEEADPRRAARLGAVLRRVRQRGKLIRHRSMPLLGGLLAVFGAAAATKEGS